MVRTGRVRVREVRFAREFGREQGRAAEQANEQGHETRF